MTATPAPAFDAVVLAGGRAVRLGGVDKAALRVGGTPLLARVLDAVAAAQRLVVVGPPSVAASLPPGRAVRLVQESPAGGGPVAALAAGLAELDGGEVVVVLATDLPFVTPAAVDDLCRALAAAPAAPARGGVDGVVAVDPSGRSQWLLGAWRPGALSGALAAGGPPAGRSMRSLVAALQVGALELRRGAADPEVEHGDVWFDVDTADDLAAARRLVEG